MPLNPRAYYQADVAQFALASVGSILGELAGNTDFDIELAQRNAWSEQIPILKTAFSGLEGTVFLEFIVPRLGSRIDAVLVSGPALFVIEFKVGAETFPPQEEYEERTSVRTPSGQIGRLIDNKSPW